MALEQPKTNTGAVWAGKRFESLTLFKQRIVGCKYVLTDTKVQPTYFVRLLVYFYTCRVTKVVHKDRSSCKELFGT